MNSQIDATIVMRCRIEKQNYANSTGFTLNLTITDGDLPFLLDSICARSAGPPACWPSYPVGRLQVWSYASILLFPVIGYNISKEKIDFSTRNVIYLWIK